MTILCPKEFHEAVDFAVEADFALDAAIRTATAEKERSKLEENRGKGTRSLLRCFGWRANSDRLSIESDIVPVGSEIEYEDGRRIRVSKDTVKDIQPIQETFIYSDFAPYSFFFREELIDPRTRKIVKVYDRAWYVIDTRKSDIADAEIDAMDEEQLNRLLDNDWCTRTYWSESAEKAELAGKKVREVMQRRTMMCGGIIYHADYDKSGNRLGYGSWSTHT